MHNPFPIPPSYIPKTVQVLHDNEEGFAPGTILEVRHARSSVFCVVHPTTLENCYIMRGQVRALSDA